MTAVMSYFSGLLFAIGLGISGMTNPDKVTNFLNVTGDWDPSLLLVMTGAASTYFIGHILILQREKPLVGDGFQLPTRRDIDRPLVVGAALFGFGWGLVGFCPGPALVAVVTGNESVIIFLLAMIVGMYAFEVLGVRFSIEPDGGAGLVTKD
jgi:uncharacterized protein